MMTLLHYHDSALKVSFVVVDHDSLDKNKQVTSFLRVKQNRQVDRLKVTSRTMQRVFKVAKFTVIDTSPAEMVVIYLVE